jgi:uncharacterized protein (TIGR04141 family)
MPRRNKKRNITFYLLKPEIQEFDQAISSLDRLDQYNLDTAVPYEAKLYVKPPSQNPPWWVAFLEQGVRQLGNLFNANSAAVLLLRASGRIFAITFGYGRNLLELDTFEREFGLRAALNTIDPDTLRSVDARTFEELTVMTRSQTSRAAGLENFRISQAQDILKAITGIPRNSDFGSRVTGADAAKITFVPSLLSLGEKCEQLFLAYRSDNYKERFGFIDQLRALKDPSKIEALNEEIIRRLRTRELGSLHFAPPEVVDLEDIESFMYEGLNDEGVSDLDVDRYFNLMDNPNSISIPELKRRKVGALYGGAAEPHYRWKLYDCVVAEVQIESKLFVLSGGTWYEVEADFSGRITRDVESHLGDNELLPEAHPGEDEQTYNNRASRERSIHLLDRKTVTPPGGRTPIEFCDLMTPDRRLVHIKRRSRSSTLSHLFSQGVVSAETFFRDPGYRLALATNLLDEGLKDAAALIPTNRPSPSDWEIVFGIIDSQRSEWPRSLPFFSKLNFKIQAERLENLGYKVSLIQVPVA